MPTGYPDDGDLVESVDLGSDWVADDGTLVTETLAYDGDTATGFVKIGKNPEDGLKITWNTGHASLAVGDIFKVFATGLHNYGETACLPHISSSAVTDTGKLVSSSWAASQFNDFTVTQAFLDELNDQGSGKFSVRFVPDNDGTGDTTCSECDQTLTAPSGGLGIPLAMYHYKTLQEIG